MMLPLIAFVLSLLGTRIALTALSKRGVMDVPNTRSNHKAPVPRGGGIAMVASALLFLTLAGMPLTIVCAALLLAAVSFVDDLKSISVHWRLLAQCIAVAVALFGFPALLFPAWLPYVWAWIFLLLFWMWYINLTNFMDGIDGITSMQTIWTIIGICVIRILHPALPVSLALQAGIVGAATLGFYWFNRSPARLFMGDVGSVTLGFLTFYLLLCLALNGEWLAALILPAYYLSDATSTLLTRLMRGEKIWQAHSQHAYQQAVRDGLTHTEVVCRISALNILLIVLAACATMSFCAGLAAIALGYLLTALLIRHFRCLP